MSDAPISLLYQAPPRNGGALVRSLFAARPAQAPDAQHGIRFDARWHGARPDATRLARYRQVCDLPDTGTLPLLYLHAMAMPLHMAILSHARFPLRLLGLVHWSNQLESLRPIANGEAMDMHCTLDGIQTTERGQSFAIHTTLSTGGSVAWRETSTFLSPLARSKSGKKTAADGGEPDWGPPIAQWAVAGNAGRRFAGPSGDWNPIHVSELTARLFGYPRAIAHGMFSAARCLALLQRDLPADAPLALDLRFKRPLLIPGQVALHTAQGAGDDQNMTRFVLKVQPSSEPHIDGTLRRL
ncbi:MaoC/PaaZ C-terminal domain-containing protein [Rhodoferax sp. TS-BS-61-7]|uniref:MaoC family dehydratase n=1 Tax=Rhodoferax sp. TS-BS-61-7 TaxID=2094194 RepID=UPI001374AE4C|nr:MaoC/PaaZ C-terminal domain-containing protein [Rhodoferax sp. TS-BS-61-7]